MINIEIIPAAEDMKITAMTGTLSNVTPFQILMLTVSLLKNERRLRTARNITNKKTVNLTISLTSYSE